MESVGRCGIKAAWVGNPIRKMKNAVQGSFRGNEGCGQAIGSWARCEYLDKDTPFGVQMK